MVPTSYLAALYKMTVTSEVIPQLLPLKENERDAFAFREHDRRGEVSLTSQS